MIGCWQEQSQLHGEFVARMGRISLSGDWAKAFSTQRTRPCTEGQEHIRDTESWHGPNITGAKVFCGGGRQIGPELWDAM